MEYLEIINILLLISKKIYGLFITSFYNYLKKIDINNKNIYKLWKKKQKIKVKNKLILIDQLYKITKKHTLTKE